MEGGDEASDSGGAATNVIELTNSDGSDAVNINIRRSNGTQFSVQASLESSVELFKSVIANNCNVAAEHQRLVYNGRMLKDDQTLKSYGMEAEHTVHLVGGFQPADSNNTSNPITEGTVAGSSSSSISITDFSGSPEFEQVLQQLQLSTHDNIHDPIILMTKVPLYHLIHNQDAMTNMIMNSPQWNDKDDNSTPYISGLLYDLLYGSLVNEIIRGIYISRGGSDKPDVITLLNANPTTSQMLEDLLWNLKLEKWMCHPYIFTEMIFPDSVQEAIDAQRREQMAREANWEANQRDWETAYASEDSEQGTGGSTTPNIIDSNVGLEEVYASQLAQLEEVGFSDRLQNLEGGDQ